jgi:hypothetical protein
MYKFLFGVCVCSCVLETAQWAWLAVNVAGLAACERAGLDSLLHVFLCV